MVALTSERNTRLRLGDLRVEPVAAAVKIWGGSLIMRNAAGYLTKGATATNCVAVGRAEKTVDNSAGANGAVNVEYRTGSFLFANSAAGVCMPVRVSRRRPKAGISPRLSFSSW